MKSIDTNPYLESIRAAYRKSPMYAKIHGEQKPAEKEQRSELALGIALDDFERELGDRINP